MVSSRAIMRGLTPLESKSFVTSDYCSVMHCSISTPFDLQKNSLLLNDEQWDAIGDSEGLLLTPDRSRSRDGVCTSVRRCGAQQLGLWQA